MNDVFKISSISFNIFISFYFFDNFRQKKSVYLKDKRITKQNIKTLREVSLLYSMSGVFEISSIDFQFFYFLYLQ